MSTPINFNTSPRQSDILLPDTTSELSPGPRHQSPHGLIGDATVDTLTFLRASNKRLCKSFYLDNVDKLQSTPYDNAYSFSVSQYPVKSIEELATQIEIHSKNSQTCLIRGQPKADLQWRDARRQKENFAEPTEGHHWLMLDIDGIQLQQDISPHSIEGIEAIIQRLPSEFHSASYFYQFSSSSGILKEDGTPRKPGISAHLFFWLDRKMPGATMAHYLRLHCIQNNYYTVGLNRGDAIRVQYDVDESVLKNPVQPHYIAKPVIGEGVICTLDERRRQDLISKMHHSVLLPDIDPRSIQLESERLDREIREKWRRDNGYQKKSSSIFLPNGKHCVASTLEKPRQSHQPTNQVAVPNPERSEARRLDRIEVKSIDRKDDQPSRIATLHLVGENSPGSWFVAEHSPTIARRHGDGATRSLKEFCPEAYAKIRDEHKWFVEVIEEHRSLSPEGFLPSFSEFITARVTLLIAPTGSGKTHAFCEFARNEVTSIDVVYAAQTIALVDQMHKDLSERGVPVQHYQRIDSLSADKHHVFVSTNESLFKISAKMEDAGRPYILVIDEAHAAIDDFASKKQKFELLCRMISRARRSILMTGTITPLQVGMIADIARRNVGGLDRASFLHVVFPPIHQFPLRICPLSSFEERLCALMRQHQQKLIANETLPRVIIILPTASMRRFRRMIESYGLGDHAMVVSRQENTQAEIEEAQRSVLPWLVSSPVFALGLNFVNPPEILWAHFDGLNVDESQIIQTINRANRAGRRCEVRLFVGQLDEERIRMRPQLQVKQEIEANFRAESDLSGDLDDFHILDRAAFIDMRTHCEKNTPKALHRLITEDAFQNYRIEPSWIDELDSDPSSADVIKGSRKIARETYDEDVATVHRNWSGENRSLLFHIVTTKEAHQRRSWGRDVIPKELSDLRSGVAAAIVGNPQLARKSGGPDFSTLRRLFGDLAPYVSSQYADDARGIRSLVSSQKILHLINFINLLQDLATGKLDGVSFTLKLRLDGNRPAVFALAKSEADYLSLNRLMEKLKSAADERSQISRGQRLQVDNEIFKIGREVLARVGIKFQKTKGPDGRNRLDPSRPIIGLNLDFDEMRAELELFARSEKAKPPNYKPEDPVRSSSSACMDLGRCRKCVHLALDNCCRLGRPVQMEQEYRDPVEPFEESCEYFTAISSPLWARVEPYRPPEKT